MPDEIEFRIINPRELEPWALNSNISKVTEIYLNGSEIIEILKKIELQYAVDEGHPTIAGAYGHLRPSILLRNLKESLVPDSYSQKYGAELLCCLDCGDSGCWSVSVSVQQDEDYVYWKNFRHNHRDWDYGLSFMFERAAYESQLEKL